MKSKIVSRLFATAAMMAGAMSLATPAEAQRVNRIIAIGDSYLDDGNLFELTGAPRPAIYPNGRFSNGTNLVDTLSLLINRPVLNYAVGGAVARAANTNLPQVQALDLQVTSFLAGGGPAAFPRSSGRFAPDDLLIVNIGANDARAFERQFGVNPTPAQLATLQAGVNSQAQLAAADAVRNLDALVAAGARNLTVLGGDVGRLPEVVGTPVAPIGTAYSNAFNTQVRQALARYADQGAIVNYLDLTLIGDRVAANPGAYGLQSAGACPTACVTTNPELVDRYLFYVDNLHLTSAGFAIVGRYAARQLEAPLHLEAQADSALFAASGFGRTLQDRLDLGTSDDQDDGPPLRLFLSGDYGQRRTSDTQTSIGYRLQHFAATGGLEYHTQNLLLGAAISYSQGDTDLLTGTGEISTDGLHFGAYANWSNGNAFVEAYGGIGQLNLEISRDAVIDRIRATPDADTIVAGGRVGYLFDLGGVKIGPVVGVDYSRASIDAFTETGDPVLTLNVSDQEDDQLIGSAGLELNGSFDVGGSRVAPFVSLAAERELNDDARTIRYSQTSAPNILNRWVVGGGEEDVYGRLSAGANLQVTRGVTVQVAGGATAGLPGGDEASASVALRVGF